MGLSPAGKTSPLHGARQLQTVRTVQQLLSQPPRLADAVSAVIMILSA